LYYLLIQNVRKVTGLRQNNFQEFIPASRVSVRCARGKYAWLAPQD
jgi:hypothetical protein